MNLKNKLSCGTLLAGVLLAGCSVSTKTTGNDTSSSSKGSSSSGSVISGSIDTLTATELSGGTFAQQGITYFVDDYPSEAVNVTFGPHVKVIFASRVAVNGKLTLLEDTKAYFYENAYIDVQEGELDVLGSDSLPVLLKNAEGGKTWGYGSTGDYTGGLWFTSSANPLSKIRYAIIDSAVTGIRTAVDGIEISNTIFQNSANYGVVFDGIKGPKKGFTGNSFSGNVTAPLQISAEALTRLDGSQIFAANESAIEVVGGTVETSGQWSSLSVPYKVTGGIKIEKAAGVSIEILAGTQLLFLQNAYLDVQVGATLKVSGTAAKPVRMNPAETGKTWGYGSAQDYSGGIWIGKAASANTSIKHLILDSASTGIYTALTGIKVDSSSFSNCDFQGIFFADDAVPTSFKNNTFADHGEYSFSIGFGGLVALDGSGTFTGTNSEVLVTGQTAATTGTIPNLPVAYHMSTSAAIENATKAVTITIAAGTHFKMEADTYFDLKENSALIANGTTLNPIILENAISGTTWGYGSAADYCGGIWINNNSTANTVMSNVTFRGVVLDVPVYNDAVVPVGNFTSITVEAGI